MEFLVTVGGNPAGRYHARNERGAALDTARYAGAGQWLPTETLLAALGTSIRAAIQAYATERHMDLADTTVAITASTGGNPLRLTTIHLTYRCPMHLADHQIDALVRAGAASTVHATLAEAVEIITHRIQPMPAARISPGPVQPR